MSVVLEIILPVFGLVLLGFFFAKMGWFPVEAEKGVTVFIFNIATPMMIFNILSQVDLPSDPPLPYFASYYGPLFFIATLGFLFSRYVFKREYTVQVITGFCSCFGNTFLLGLPILIISFGEEKLVPFYLLLSVHGLTLFTLITIMLEIGLRREAAHKGHASSNLDIVKTILKSLLKNPVLMSIVFAIGVNFGGLEVPTVVMTMTGIMKGAVVPSALFAMGVSLTQYGIRGRIWESLTVVSLKIILMPILVYLLCQYVFDIDPLWTMIAVITAAQPPGVMGYMFASRYQVGQAVASTSIFVASAGAIVTLSWILYFFNVR